MNESKAMILGCGGLTLDETERAFFADERPWGFILFARNVSEPEQLHDLVANLRDSVGRPNAPVLIDQEGGRVQRIRPPIVSAYPPGAAIGHLYSKDREAGLRAAWLLGRLHAADLTRFGINVDCLPVLDVASEGLHDAIGDRALSADPDTVIRLASRIAEGLMAGGVLPVAKHMPGHGRALVDSHLDLPVVKAGLADLEQTDFKPFRALASLPMAMTAHIVYADIDPERPATTSAKVIGKIIRQSIGFNGLLMSDDISMKALSGDFASKAGAIFEAECDVILHCNGDMKEMAEVAANTPVLMGDASRRAGVVEGMFGAADPCDANALRAEFDRLVTSASQMISSGSH